MENKAAAIPLEKIPTVLYERQLTEIERLQLSQQSKLTLENLYHSGTGRLFDAAIQFIPKKDSEEPELSVKEIKPVLTIPASLEEHRFTREEILALKNGQELSVKTSSGINAIKLDQKNNRLEITLSAASNLPITQIIPSVISGYTLTQTDKQRIQQGVPIPPRVYQNTVNGNYFVANIQIKSNKLTLSDYKPIPIEQAQTLKDKLNRESTPLQDATSVIKEVKHLQTNQEKKLIAFEQHVEQRNFSAIKEMTDKGFSVTTDHIKNLTEKFNYTAHEKGQLTSAVNFLQKPKTLSLDR